MNREIKPEDVERLIREGKLRLKESLDCSPEFNGKAFFIGVSFHNNIVIENCIGQFIEVEQARFPLPDLRDGDPVIVGDDSRHFAELRDDGIMVYPWGRTKWTYSGEGTLVIDSVWRLPTPDELEAGGYPRDYYTKRGIG